MAAQFFMVEFKTTLVSEFRDGMRSRSCWKAFVSSLLSIGLNSRMDYNVIHMYTYTSVVFHTIWSFSKVNPSQLFCHIAWW